MELRCRNLLFYVGLIVTFCCDFISPDDDKVSDRYPDKPFPLPITIHGKNVTCIDKQHHKPGLYPSQTWTCEDMRVDSRRLAYGYNPSRKKDKACEETEGWDDLGEVCREMMRKMGAKKELWAAFVTNATCNYIDEHRYMLNMSGPDMYTWHPMKQGYGWIYTLRCMALP